MTYMFKEKQVKLARMGEVVFGITGGTEEERARQTITACEDFFRRMGLNTRLSECGITENDLDALAAPVDKQGWHLGEHHNIDSKVTRYLIVAFIRKKIHPGGKLIPSGRKSNFSRMKLKSLSDEYLFE